MYIHVILLYTPFYDTYIYVYTQIAYSSKYNNGYNRPTMIGDQQYDDIMIQMGYD